MTDRALFGLPPLPRPKRTLLQLEQRRGDGHKYFTVLKNCLALRCGLSYSLALRKDPAWGDKCSTGDKPGGPQLVRPDATKKSGKRLTADDRFDNFCKAMAEQELFESGAFPNAKDARTSGKSCRKWSSRLLTRRPKSGAKRLK